MAVAVEIPVERVGTDPRPVRSIIREFLIPIVDANDELDSRDVITAAYDAFRHDNEFLQAALRDLVPTLVPEVLNQIVRERKAYLIKMPSGYVSREGLEFTAAERLSRIFQSTGDGIRRRMLLMTKAELLEMNARDERQIGSMRRWIDLRTDLASRLKDDQVVGDLPAATLEQVWREHLEVEVEEQE